ncbi:MAG: ankyrin repeat domain-containing protein [Legionella sp.]
MSTQLIEAISNDQYRKACALVMQDAIDFNLKDEDGRTAMHLAAEKGYNFIIKILLEKGQPVDSAMDNQGTALLVAAASGHIQTVQLLIDSGANILAKDKDENTALIWAIKGSHLPVVQFLIDKSTKQQKKTLLKYSLHHSVRKDTRASLQITQLLLKAGAPLNAILKKQVPLHYAAENGCLLQTRLLVKKRAKTTVENAKEETPIDIAQKKGYTRLHKFLNTPYDDKTASDTDSEDEADYDYTDDFAPLSAVQPPAKTFIGALDGENIQFQESEVASDGDCGFSCLGVSREELTDTLKANADNEQIREALWLEVVEALINKDFLTQNSDDILDEFYTQNSDEARETLKSFCIEKKTFIAYLKALANNKKKIWLGYQSALEFAKCRNWNIYIWQPGQKTNDLKLYSSQTCEQPEKTIHLLHTASFTHFNRLTINDPEIAPLATEVQNLSIPSPPVTPIKQKSSSSKPIIDDKQSYIAHYRGLHFYPGYYSRQARRRARKIHELQEQGILPRTGQHSMASHEKSHVPLKLPKINTEEPDIKKITKELLAREKKLNAANTKIKTKMRQLQKTGPVEACLQHSGKASREEPYDSRYMEFIQRYVNSYKTFMEDIKMAPTKNLNDGRLSSTTKEKWTILKSLEFSTFPFVSTTEEARWALEYAFSLVNWDKNDDHQPRKEAIPVLTPSYQADGHARFPYLGIVYATLHSPKSLTKETNSTRIIDLFVDNKIDTKCASPGGHIRGGYVKARERIFIGGIEAKYIYLTKTVRVPNLSGEYRSFYKKKYNIDKQDFTLFKNKLHEYGANSSGKKKNEKEFHRTEQAIIEHVIQSQQTKIEDELTKILRDRGDTLIYCGIQRDTLSTELPSIEDIVENKTPKK